MADESFLMFLYFENRQNIGYSYSENLVLKTLDLIVIPYLNLIYKEDLRIFMFKSSPIQICLDFNNYSPDFIQRFARWFAEYISRISSGIGSLFGKIYSISDMLQRPSNPEILADMSPDFFENDEQTMKNIEHILLFPDFMYLTEEEMLEKEEEIMKRKLIQRGIENPEPEVVRGYLREVKRRISVYLNEIFAYMEELNKITNQNDEDNEIKEFEEKYEPVFEEEENKEIKPNNKTNLVPMQFRKKSKDKSNRKPKTKSKRKPKS
jgi:hypothetical protein